MSKNPEVDLALRLNDLEDAVKVMQRSNQLSRGSIIDQSLGVYDRNEILSLLLGEQFDGTVVLNAITGPIPPTPSAPTATAGVRSAVVHWDGLYEFNEIVPLDFSRVEIHASLSPAYDGSLATTIVGTYESPRGGDRLVSLPTVGDTYTIKLVARSLSGKRSPASAGVSVVGTNPASDGIPPTAGPTTVTVYGGIGSLGILWNTVANADPVTYHLHVRDGAPPVLDGTYEVAQGVGMTRALVETLKSGVPIVSDGSVIYYVAVTVSDQDSPATPLTWPSSPVVTGIGRQVVGPDVSASVVTTDFLMANEAFIGALNSVDMRAVTMTSPTIQTDSEDNKGIKLSYDEAGNAYLRAWGPDSESPFFDLTPNLGFLILAGEATLRFLTVLYKATFRQDPASLDPAIALAPGAQMKLLSGVDPPTNTPSVGSSYATQAFNAVDYGSWNDKRGLGWDGASYYTYDLATNRFEKWSGTTGNRQANVVINPGDTVMSNGGWDHASVAFGGGKAWLMCWQTFPGFSGGQAAIVAVSRIEETTMTVEATDSYSFIGAGMSSMLASDGRLPCIGYAEGQVNPVMIFQTDKINFSRVHRCTFTGGSIVKVSTNTLAFSEVINATSLLWDDQFDFADGTARYVISTKTSDHDVFTASGTYDQRVTDHWSAGIADRVGLIWDDTAGEFRIMSRTGLLRTYTQIGKAAVINSAEMNKWIRVAYHRPSGPWESDPSPVYNYPNFPKRSRLSVTGPAVPAVPGTEEPDRLRVYIGYGATEPAAASMWLQTSPAVGLSNITYTLLSFAGAGLDDADPDFPSNGNSEIVSQATDGDGALTRIGSKAGFKLRGTPDDSAVLTASGAYTGTVQVTRYGNRILLTGFVDRAASFNATFEATGVVMPTWARPTGTRHFRGGVQFSNGTRYRLRVIATTGVLEVQQSAAMSENMLLNDVFML